MKESRVIISVLWGRQKGLALEKSRLRLNTGVHYLCNLDLSPCSLWDLNLLQKSRMKNTFYELYCENRKWIMESAWPWQMLKEKVMSPSSTVFLTSVPDFAHLSQSSDLQRFLHCHVEKWMHLAYSVLFTGIDKGSDEALGLVGGRDKKSGSWKQPQERHPLDV